MPRKNPDSPPAAWRAAPTQPTAFTIDEFCAAHRLSPEMYFKLKRNGRGPREMQVGRRRMISAEAAARWRRQRERQAATGAATTAA